MKISAIKKLPVLALIAIGAQMVSSQSSASLRGAVTDANGAIATGAAIVLTEAETTNPHHGF